MYFIVFFLLLYCVQRNLFHIHNHSHIDISFINIITFVRLKSKPSNIASNNLLLYECISNYHITYRHDTL